MDFELNEVQRQVQRTIREFVDKEVIPVASDYEHKDEYPHPIVEKMKEMGLFGFLISEDYGGSEMDYVSYAVLMEELSRGWMSVGGVIGSHGMTAWIIETYGTEEQKRKFLPDLAKGIRRSGMALTEPESGSDSASLRTTARLEGDEFIINGTKMFITNSEMGTTFSVFVRTHPDASLRHKGISCLIIEKGMPGFSVGRHLNKLGYRGVRSSELIFQDCRVPVENLIGEENQGFYYIMAGLETGRINVAARGVGLAQAAFEDSIKYAQQRIQGGKPICQHQTIQIKLAEMATRIEASRMMTYMAADKRNRGERCDLEAGMAKLFASETAEFCASEGIQIHGGYGYINEFNVERYFRDCKLLTVGEGTNEIQRLLIARRLLERYSV